MLIIIAAVFISTVTCQIRAIDLLDVPLDCAAWPDQTCPAWNPILTPPNPKPTLPYVAPEKAKYDYSEALHISQIWFDIQRSGVIKPQEQRLGWRASSCVDCKGDYGEDLSQAWYEAANTMKWGLPLYWTIMQVGMNIYMFKDGYTKTNELNHALEILKWGTDYLLNARINDELFVGQLGVSSNTSDVDIDFAYYFAPEYYDKYHPRKEDRHPALYISPEKPAGDIAGIAAAALMVGAVLFKEFDAAYADKLYVSAQSWYNFGVKYPTSYNTPASKGNKADKWYAACNWYPSTSVDDDLSLAAFFLYKYSNETRYLNSSIAYYNAGGKDAWTEQSWDSQGGLLHTLLYEETKDPMYLALFKSAFVDARLPGGTMPISPYGLSHPDLWGTFALNMNACVCMMKMAKVLGKDDPYAQKMVTFCIQQVNYLLGDSGYTWMVGFGTQPAPTRLNHVSSYNPYDADPNITAPFLADFGALDFFRSERKNSRIAYGGIPSGPDLNDRYLDDRQTYQYSEATQDYTAPAIGVFAAMMEWYGVDNFKPFSDCTLDLGWDENGKNGLGVSRPTYPKSDCYHTCNTGPQCSFAVTLFNTDGQLPDGARAAENSSQKLASFWSFSLLVLFTYL